jgi:hypothetical protein
MAERVAGGEARGWAGAIQRAYDDPWRMLLRTLWFVCNGYLFWYYLSRHGFDAFFMIVMGVACIMILVSVIPTLDRVRTLTGGKLAGIANYDGVRISGLVVEECSADWSRSISRTRTDSEGRFELPSSAASQERCLRVSLSR